MEALSDKDIVEQTNQLMSSLESKMNLAFDELMNTSKLMPNTSLLSLFVDKNFVETFMKSKDNSATQLSSQVNNSPTLKLSGHNQQSAKERRKGRLLGMRGKII